MRRAALLYLLLCGCLIASSQSFGQMTMTGVGVPLQSVSAGLPAGALGVWYADQYQNTNSNPLVPNSATATPVSENLFRGSRRLFANTSYWSAGSTTITDNAATAPDGSNDASTSVGTGNWTLGVANNATLGAGTYTIAINAKSNTGSNQQFSFSPDNTGTRSSPFTATSSWQRFSYTFTVGAANIQRILLCSIDGTTGANLQIIDLELFPGSSDLGPETYAGHWYLGSSAPASSPTYSSGAVDFTGGGWGLIQFAPPATSFSTITALAAVKKVVSGGIYQGFLSNPQSYTNFSAVAEVSTSSFNELFAGQNSTSGSEDFWELNSQGWHMVSLLYDGTNLQSFLDDDIIFHSANVGSVGPVSMDDFWQLVNNSSLPADRTQIAAMALYPTALTGTQIRQVYNVFKARLALSSNTMVAARVLVSEGDSITATQSPTAYPYLYNSAPPSPLIVGFDNAVSGSTIADLVTRSTALNAVLPATIGTRKFILSVLIGANDLLGYSGGTSAWLSALASYLDGERSAGWLVAISTVLPQTTTGFNTQQALANTTIKTWVGVHADALIDYTTDANLNNAANTTYFSDGVHPTAAGQSEMESVYAPVINGM